jgi:hypothetical protein
MSWPAENTGTLPCSHDDNAQFRFAEGLQRRDSLLDQMFTQRVAVALVIERDRADLVGNVCDDVGHRDRHSIDCRVEGTRGTLTSDIYLLNHRWPADSRVDSLYLCSGCSGGQSRYLGTEAESLSRSLPSLAALGVVVRGLQITLTDCAALEGLAGSALSFVDPARQECEARPRAPCHAIAPTSVSPASALEFARFG